MDNTSSTSRALNDDRSRIVLQVTSVIVAAGIALHSFIVKEPVLTLIGAAVWFAAGVLWTRRGGNGGPLTIALLASWEILASFFLTEEFAAEGDVATWIIAVHLVSVAAALIAALATLRGTRTSMRHATSS
jgi:hypothetical protein